MSGTLTRISAIWSTAGSSSTGAGRLPQPPTAGATAIKKRANVLRTLSPERQSPRLISRDDLLDRGAVVHIEALPTRDLQLPRIQPQLVKDGGVNVGDVV